jgi:hypothetical protein
MLVKNFILLVSFIAFLAILNSCSEDIDLTTDTKSIPVVYCVINPQDSIYRVLLSRTFNGNKSTFEMAQDPDMIYYKNARVSLEAWSKGYPIWNTQFKPAATTRDSGYFSSSPGFAFETKEVISKHFGHAASQNFGELSDYLRLVVEYQDDAEPAFSRISTSLSKPRIEYPVYSYKVFNLCDSIPYYLVFNTSDILYYDLRCKFRYTEDSETGEYKTVDFSVQPNIQTNIGKKQLFIYPSVFFRRLALAFPNTDKISSRKFVSLDLEL